MSFIAVLLSFLAVLSAILMIVVILLQSNKSGGGLGAVSGGVTETMFGTAASSVLLKATVWLAVIFMGSTLLLATVTGRVRGSKSLGEKLAPMVEESAPTAVVPEEAPEDSPVSIEVEKTVEEGGAPSIEVEKTVEAEKVAPTDPATESETDAQK